MRHLKKIFKWTGFTLLFLMLGITLTVMGRQNVKYNRPYPAITATADTSISMRGKHMIPVLINLAEKALK